MSEDFVRGESLHFALGIFTKKSEDNRRKKEDREKEEVERKKKEGRKT